jgi:hypothetical protein
MYAGFFCPLVFSIFCRKPVLPATTNIIFYRTKIFSISVLFSNLNFFGKFWKNLWMHFEYLGRNTCRYFWYSEEREITVPSVIFTQPRKNNLDCPSIFFRRKKLPWIQNILSRRQGTIHADLHVHLSDWISHQNFTYINIICSNIYNFRKILKNLWICFKYLRKNTWWYSGA